LFSISFPSCARACSSPSSFSLSLAREAQFCDFKRTSNASSSLFSLLLFISLLLSR
jgi:hypothetical protein